MHLGSHVHSSPGRGQPTVGRFMPFKQTKSWVNSAALEVRDHWENLRVSKHATRSKALEELSLSQDRKVTPGRQNGHRQAKGSGGVVATSGKKLWA